ncbi:hypothetical protein JXJ21_17330 [candidate division KSB1 bacterium]|nr:hypothetical protein [candidate division KSB1 bacterium]
MKSLLKIISYLGLAATVVPSCLVFTGTIELETHKLFMAIGMIAWFLTAPFWMHKNAT